MKAPQAGRLTLTTEVRVVLPGRRPLPVVERLLLAAHVLVEQGPERAQPSHVGVRQEGRGGRQVATFLRAQEAVGRFGEDDDARQRGAQGPAVFGRVARPPKGLGDRRQRREFRGGAARQLVTQGVAFLLQSLPSCESRVSPLVDRAVRHGLEAERRCLLLRLVRGARGADAVVSQGAWRNREQAVNRYWLA